MAQGRVNPIEFQNLIAHKVFQKYRSSISLQKDVQVTVFTQDCGLKYIRFNQVLQSRPSDHSCVACATAAGDLSPAAGLILTIQTVV